MPETGVKFHSVWRVMALDGGFHRKSETRHPGNLSDRSQTTGNTQSWLRFRIRTDNRPSIPRYANPELLDLADFTGLLHHKPLNLLVSQCDHRVNLRGAASWNIAG
jgi:hypothetical protein